jgi:hypothetical protein
MGCEFLGRPVNDTCWIHSESKQIIEYVPLKKNRICFLNEAIGRLPNIFYTWKICVKYQKFE